MHRFVALDTNMFAGNDPEIHETSCEISVFFTARWGSPDLNKGATPPPPLPNTIYFVSLVGKWSVTLEVLASFASWPNVCHQHSYPGRLLLLLLLLLLCLFLLLLTSAWCEPCLSEPSWLLDVAGDVWRQLGSWPLKHTLEEMPEYMSDRMPNRTSIHRCQIESQNECLKVCISSKHLRDLPHDKQTCILGVQNVFCSKQMTDR